MIVLAMCAVLASQTAAKADCWSASVQEMIAAERAFAKLSAERGIREAFVTYLTEDAVMLQPGPVPGQPRYRQLPPGYGDDSLAWGPDFAELAVSCDLGLSIGPWEYRPDRTDPNKAYFGHYVSLWRRLPDIGWRVIFDGGGTVHEKQPSQPSEVEIAEPLAPSTSEWSESVRDRAVDEVRDADRRFWRSVAADGLSAALDTVAAERVRYIPGRGLPVVGKRQALAALPTPAKRWETETTGAGASLAGDFGYTLGGSRRSPSGADAATEGAEAGGYMIVWRRDASREWRIVLFTSNHVPEQKTAAPRPAS